MKSEIEIEVFPLQSYPARLQFVGDVVKLMKSLITILYSKVDARCRAKSEISYMLLAETIGLMTTFH